MEHPRFVFRCLLITLATTLWHEQGQGRLITSTSKLNRFANLDLAAGLKRYLDHETKRMGIIKDAKGYEDEVPILKTRLERLHSLQEEVAKRKAELDSVRSQLSDSHPTSVFRAFANFLKIWEDKMNDTKVYGFRLAEFLSNDDQSTLPKESDLSFLGQALAEIQFVYNLSTAEIFAGKVMSHQGTPLEPSDAHQIARSAMELSHLDLAISWFEIALKNTPEEEMRAKNASYPVADAMSSLGVLKYGMGDKQEGLELLERATDLDPDNDRILREYLRHRHGRNLEPLVRSDPEELVKHWFWLCANASSAVLKPLKWYHVCRYRRSMSAPYRLYREEVLSRSPFLSVIHSLVTPKEARLLINASRTKVRHPAILGAESFLYNVDGTQLKQNETIAREIAQRITDMTGLDTTERKYHSSGEPLHVLNYGVAGSFHPHQDTNRYSRGYMMNLSGLRMASVLIYLSNVKSGGATAFPHLNITITPKVGEALLWYNTNPIGEIEPDILHAGCPVAVGTKWVASKGIWSWGNELRRPCGRKLTSSHMAVDKIAPRSLSTP